MDLPIRANPPVREAQASERGFTLVELMIVVAIIALLASVVIPNFVHAKAQAAVSQSMANMKQISTALEEYYDDVQDYPAGTGASVAPALFKPPGGGATNPYMSVTPTNALARATYKYTYTGRSTGGAPPTYLLTDPGNYDPSTLQNLTKGAGGAATCGIGSCKNINYDPQDGFYGS